VIEKGIEIIARCKNRRQNGPADK
jgi:hypothetical protein